MKKVYQCLFAGILAFTMTACVATDNNSNDTTKNETNQPKQQPAQEQSPESQGNEEDKKSLVVYFSYSGNTEKIANLIAQKTDADTFEIVPVNAYPSDYDECVDLASEEKSQNARPEIKDTISNIDQYDTIYLGYPCWWGTAPMITFTFLESYDMSGKTIIPFTTHGGSGFGSSVNDVRASASGAAVSENGLTIRDSKVDSSTDTVSSWIESLK